MKLPRFTLRELFLIVVIAAMGCGWWVASAERSKLETRLMEQERVSRHWRDTSTALRMAMQSMADADPKQSIGKITVLDENGKPTP